METKICRICGRLTQNYVHIFKTEGLKSKIETCLPIIVSPYCLLPDLICEECAENVDNFHSFIKHCLQSILVLEAQCNVQESCLKSKRKRDKGCSADFAHTKSSRAVQTEDFLDVITGNHFDLEEYSKQFPLTHTFLQESRVLQQGKRLVEYDPSSDTEEEEVETNPRVAVKVPVAAKSEFTSNFWNNLRAGAMAKNARKRKGDVIETCRTKICKLDGGSKRKSKVPKKLDVQYGRLGSVHDDAGGAENVSVSGDVEQQQNSACQTNAFFLSLLPQNCLLCDTPYPSAAALAVHVFQTHGIDMAEVVSSGSGESFPEKNKKKMPQLVKISDLKRSNSMDDGQLQEDAEQAEEHPPALLPSFACSDCPAMFANKPDLGQHVRAKHPELASYMCGLCASQCTSAANLRTHLQTCSRSNPVRSRYYCEVCGYGDEGFKALENHVLVHGFLLDAAKKQARMFDPADYVSKNDGGDLENASPPSPGLTCDECDSSKFESFRDFSAHRRTEHSVYHCDLCGKFYGRNSHLWKHVNRLHKGQPSITCQLCCRTSASKYHLAQHFNKIHSAKEKGAETAKREVVPAEGAASEFGFRSVKECLLRQEILSNIRREVAGPKYEEHRVEEDALSKLEAPKAPKEIDSSHDLYTNIITNYDPPANEGDHKCPKCSKAFHKKILLKKHKKNCRPKMQKDLLTRCKTCARVFKDRQSLAKHLVNYHSEYACEMCGEKVQSKCEIVSHIRFRHPGCHLFCSQCGNVLRSREDLRRHSEDHSASHVCQFCGDSLPSKIKLKMHVLSLHRKILSLSCGICLKLFENQHVLKDHVTLVHKAQLKPLVSCPVCGKDYGSKWKTYDHLNKSHGRMFKACKTCLEVFNNEAQLQAHCDVTTHGNHGGLSASMLRNTIIAQITSAINHVAASNMKNVEDDYEEDSEEENDTSSGSGESDAEQTSDTNPSSLRNDAKISLLEKRLLGKKGAETVNNEFGTKGVSKSEPKACVDEAEQGNPPVNSSKRTVYINSNDPSCCEICLKTWPAKKHLWQHYIRCHKSVAATVCGICLTTNESYEALQTHLKEEHPTLLHGQGFGSNFICKVCGRYHNASSKLRLHMVIHENFDWKLLDGPDETRNDDDNDQKPRDEPSKDESRESRINYESLIEQVECSSQSDNDDDDYGTEEKPEVVNEDDSDSNSILSEAKSRRTSFSALFSEDSSSACSEGSRSEDSSEEEENSPNLPSNNGDFCERTEELDSEVTEETGDFNVNGFGCDLQGLNEIELAVGSIL